MFYLQRDFLISFNISLVDLFFFIRDNLFKLAENEFVKYLHNLVEYYCTFKCTYLVDDYDKLVSKRELDYIDIRMQEDTDF